MPTENENKITIESLFDKNLEQIKNLQAEKKEELVALVKLPKSDLTTETVNKMTQLREEVDILVDTYTQRLEVENAQRAADRAELVGRLQNLPVNVDPTKVKDDAQPKVLDQLTDTWGKMKESGSKAGSFTAPVNLLQNRVLNAVSTTTTGISPEPVSQMTILRPMDSSILDLITGYPAQGGAFKYRRETSTTTTATKPEGTSAAVQDFTFEDVEPKLKRSAGYIQVTVEQLEYNMAAVAMQVNSSLQSKVRRAAANTAITDILGAVIAGQTVAKQTDQTIFDYIALVQKKAYNAEGNPDLLVVHPNTGLKLRLSRDGDDTFLNNPLSGMKSMVVFGELMMAPSHRIAEEQLLIADSMQIGYTYSMIGDNVRIEAGYVNNGMIEGVWTVCGVYPIAGLLFQTGAVAKGTLKA